MKKSLFRSTIFFISCAVLCALMFMNAGAATVKSGDFIFDVSGSTATLKEYTGNASSVTVPSKVNKATVTVIGAEAFWKKTAMTAVSLPSTITKIEYAAFNECSSLTKIVIPSKVTSIGEGVFWYCKSLKSAFIPASVKSIGNNAFKGCDSLTAYVIKGSYGESHIKTLSNVKLAYRYATAVTLSKTAVQLAVGDSFVLKATLSPTPLYINKVTFSSSDAKALTVSAGGTVKAVSCGTYTVTAAAADGSGKKAVCTVTVVPQKVSGISVTGRTVSGYTLTWKKTAGAAGYKVYRYDTAKKAWQALGTTTGLTYKITSQAVGSTASYKIHAYTKVSGKYYFSPASPTVKASTLSPGLVSSLKGTSTNNSVSLSWQKAENANGYYVFLYNTATKKYKLKASVTGTGATITGLAPNTDYLFAVRAFYQSGSSTVMSPSFVKLNVRTRPDYVSGLRAEKENIYTNRLTLSWDYLKGGVTGYQIAQYDSSTKAYKTVKTITGASNTSCEIGSLVSGTTYSFKVRAFKKIDSTVTYGYYSSAVSVTTPSIPTTPQAAFESFITAFNDTKKFTANAALYRDTEIVNFQGENSSEYAGVLRSIAKEESESYTFKNGKDIRGKTVSDYLYPVGAVSTLTYADIKNDSLSFGENGSGYALDFTLPRESNPRSNSLIAPTVDWDQVKAENESFSLISCTYSGTKISAKVQGGLISHMEISTPMEVTFTLNSKTYTFSQTVITTYAFITF